MAVYTASLYRDIGINKAILAVLIMLIGIDRYLTLN